MSYRPLATSEQTADEHTPAEPLKRNYRRRNLFIALGLGSLAFVLFKTGQHFLWPSTKSTELPTSTSPGDSEHCQNCAPHGKYSVGYFTNWGIYDHKFPPALIPTDDLTHLLYSFANVKPETGDVVLSDLWADQDKHYTGDSWNDIGNNLYGSLKQIYKLKKKNRHFKVLLSIGGWTYSPKIDPIVVNPALRARFIETAVDLLEDYGFDGLDIDYEFPKNESQAIGYSDLLKETRLALDKHAAKKGEDCHFSLTIAAPCTANNYETLRVADMDKSLDFWNLMCYDFTGKWSKIADHQANLYGSGHSVSRAVDWFIKQGVKSSKLVLGIPLYGISAAGTDGPGKSRSGSGPGTWVEGFYDYRTLPLPGSTIHVDKKLGASWSYDASKKEMISFDTEEIGRMKGEYIKKKNLGGGMFWELSSDKGPSRDGLEGGPGRDPQPGESLVTVVRDAMGPLDTSRNWLSYRDSKFYNMRVGIF